MPLPWIPERSLSERDMSTRSQMSPTPTIALPENSYSRPGQTRNTSERDSRRISRPLSFGGRGSHQRLSSYDYTTSSTTLVKDDSDDDADSMETKASDSDCDSSRNVSGTAQNLTIPSPPPLWRNGSVENQQDESDLKACSAVSSPSRLSFISMSNLQPLTRSSFPPRMSAGSVWQTKGGDEIPTMLADLKGVPEQQVPTPMPVQETPGMGIWRERVFIFSVSLAQLFSLAGLSQSVAPLFIISRSFGVDDPGQMSWYTAAYSMTLAAFILPAGRLGDMYGHKKMFLIGWVWFSTWSLICGFSYIGGPVMLSTCRGLQGIGPALLVPNGIALLGRNFPLGMKRAMAIAIFGGCAPVGFAVGAFFASLIAQLLWWPWIFWVTSIACLCACCLAYFAVPADPVKPKPEGLEPREQFDLLGAVTGVSGLLLINFALNEAPVVGWNVAWIPVVLALGVLLMVAFVYVELCVAAKPIVPLRGLHRDAAFTLACIAAGWASHGIWVYYFFLLLNGIRAQTPLLTAAEFLFVAPIGFFAAVIVPRILKRIRVPYLMSAAMAIFALAIVFLLTAPAHQTYWANTFISVLIAPFAMNWSFPAATILMSNAVAKHHQGIAASLVATMVNYSIATGLGVAGTIARYTTPSQGILGGFHDAWWLGIAFASTGFVISLYFIVKTRARQPTAPK